MTPILVHLHFRRNGIPGTGKYRGVISLHLTQTEKLPLVYTMGTQAGWYEIIIHKYNFEKRTADEHFFTIHGRNEQPITENLSGGAKIFVEQVASLIYPCVSQFEAVYQNPIFHAVRVARAAQRVGSQEGIFRYDILLLENNASATRELRAFCRGR